MTTHHDRVRAVLLVHRLEAERAVRAGERSEAEADTVVELTARVARIQARHDGARERVAGQSRDGRGPAGSAGDADGDRWLLAVYDAALAELCGALGMKHSLVDRSVSSDDERQRVELELLSVLPFVG